MSGDRCPIALVPRGRGRVSGVQRWLPEELIVARWVSDAIGGPFCLLVPQRRWLISNAFIGQSSGPVIGGGLDLGRFGVENECP